MTQERAKLTIERVSRRQRGGFSHFSFQLLLLLTFPVLVAAAPAAPAPPLLVTFNTQASPRAAADLLASSGATVLEQFNGDGTDVLVRVGGIAQAVALVGVGIAIARTGHWSGWRRFWPLALALYVTGALVIPALAGVEPAAVTEVFIFLASDESEGVTGRRFQAQEDWKQQARNPADHAQASDA